jgi:hypothetical protein
MKRQYDEQFPEGIDVFPLEKFLPMYNALLTHIINDADNGHSAISTFRTVITEHASITSGRHFNMQNFVAAQKVFSDNIVVFNNKSEQMIFWHQIIGFIQRQMPANYAQVYCSGIKQIIKDPSIFKRTLDIYPNRPFFPLHDAEGLGFHFAVYPALLPTSSCRRLPSGLPLKRWGVFSGGDTFSCAPPQQLITYIDQKIII